MIYLKDGNTPLNEAWADEICQEGNYTYQLTFKYPLNNDKWKLLTEETKLIADDLNGEQEFTIFEVVKEQGYITVYANQVATLLNYYSISSINVDRVAGNVVMTALAGAILRDCPFSFYSDITDKHTFNAANLSVMDALIKEKHSIVGQWGGDLVRDKYQVSLLKNGGSETEALFMYKKNMRSPQQTTSTKELRTRIHFRKKIEVGEGDNRKEQWLRVTVDSPLISKYKHIYEADMEVTDEDVKDLASLTKYGEQYYRTTLCDMIEDSLELDVSGIGDVPVKIFDVVSVYHEQFEIDVRKKITKYRYSPMGKRLKSVGFGTIQQTLGSALNAMVSDSVKAEAASIEQDFAVKLEKELKNADKVFDQKMNQMEQSLSDEIEQAKAKAEEVKAAMTEQLNLKINQSKSEVTDKLQKEFYQKLSGVSTDLAGVRANLTQAQSQLSANISQIRSDVGAIRNQQTLYEQSNTQNLARITGQLGDKASKAEVKQTADRIREEIASLSVGGRNLLGVFNTHCVKSTFDIDTYRLSGKTDKNTNTTSLQLQFLWTDGSYTSVITINTLGAFCKAFKIKKTYKEFIVKYNSNKEDAKLICRDPELLKLNEDYLFTGVLSNLSPNDSVAEYLKIEKGTLPSDWSKAPEDAESLITEAKATFERTAQGLRTDLTAVQSYVSADGARTEALQKYSREETARQLTAERKLIEAGYVAKATYTEDAKGINRRFEELKSSSEAKLAEYRQTVDGQFATMSSKIGESLKKTDISITPGQITLGTGKVVNGQTLASLFVQNPQSMEAITKLMRITGDLIVDGSITGRDLAAGAITTPHLAAGAVTAEALAANAVTADKIKAEDALIEKLTAGEAMLKKLMAKNGFINRLQSIDFTAEQVKGGILSSINGATKFDLYTGALDFYTSNPVLRRTLEGFPNQFIKFDTGKDNGKDVGVTIIGSNRWGTENSNNGGFVGIRAWNGPTTDCIDVVGDTVRLTSSPFDSVDGWEISTTGKLQIYPKRQQDKRNSIINVGDVWLSLDNSGNTVSLHQILKQLANSIGALYDYRGRNGEGTPSWWDSRHSVGRL